MPRISPLHDLIARPGLPLPLTERAFLGRLIVRGHADETAFGAAVHAVLDLPVPTVPNTVAQAGDTRLLWLGPDEWQVQTPDALRASVLAQLRASLQGLHAAVTDVSDGYAEIVLDHPRAAEVLARGCPLDLHPSAFAVGRCGQTLLGKAGVLLVREGPGRFAITARRSLAAYVFRVLQDAGALALA